MSRIQTVVKLKYFRFPPEKGDISCYCSVNNRGCFPIFAKNTFEGFLKNIFQRATFF